MRTDTATRQAHPARAARHHAGQARAVRIATRRVTRWADQVARAAQRATASLRRTGPQVPSGPLLSDATRSGLREVGRHAADQDARRQAQDATRQALAAATARGLLSDPLASEWAKCPTGLAEPPSPPSASCVEHLARSLVRAPGAPSARTAACAAVRVPSLLSLD